MTNRTKTLNISSSTILHNEINLVVHLYYDDNTSNLPLR